MRRTNHHGLDFGDHGRRDCRGISAHRLLAPLLVSMLAAGCGSQGEVDKPSPKPKAVQTEARPDAKPGTGSDTKPLGAAITKTKPATTVTPEPAKTVLAEPVEQFELLATVEAEFADILAIAFAPDGRTFVTGGSVPKIWKLGAEEPLHAFEDLFPIGGTVVEALALAIAADGSLLAIGANDGKLHLFDLATKDSKKVIEAHENGVVSVTFSTDAKTLVTSGYDGKVKLWRTATGEPLQVLDAENERALYADITPDGKIVASAGENVLLWNAESGAKLGELNLGEPRVVRVSAIAFSPNGKQVATAEPTVEFENGVQLWSVDDRQHTATLKQEFGMSALAFSPNGRLLATAGMDDKARLWRLADRELLQTFEEDSVNQVGWTPDGKLLAVGSAGTIRFWGPEGALEVTKDDSQGNSPTETPAKPEAVGASDPSEKAAAPEAAADLPKPATIEQLTEALDLPNFPKIEGGDYQTTKATELGYLAPVTVPEARDFYRRRLAEAGWKEQKPSGSEPNTDESWLRLFEKDGFFVQLFLNKQSSLPEGQKISVEFIHKGNIDTRRLPMPPDAEKTFETVTFTAYTTAANSDASVKFCRDKFKALGWQERPSTTTILFGGTSLRFVRNAVRLDVGVRWKLTGKTGVDYSVSPFEK